MEHVRWTVQPDLTEPVLIAAFEGWSDAGDAATTAARYLVDRWDTERIAEIDPEEFFDFSSTRPQVRLDDEGQREIVWPATEVFTATIPGGIGEVVIVIGHEPQLRWRTFSEQVVTVAKACNARLVITLGALLAEVPHTRPTTVVGTAYETDTVAGIELQPSSYEGPTGIVGVLHDACRRAGFRSASLWATVPSYVPGAPSPKAALALIERTAAMLDTWVATTDLEIASASYERQVSELVDDDEETSTYVTSLEERHDSEPGVVPTAESIAEEVERFLREHPE
ncbi:MAG: PAC2 family protein [Acidimicrobiales bacterium]|nr:PAC2 family protein [Acidimicrobiales bacterium]